MADAKMLDLVRAKEIRTQAARIMEQEWCQWAGASDLIIFGVQTT
jgi:hypothetical protein